MSRRTMLWGVAVAVSALASAAMASGGGVDRPASGLL